jgi:hypothetical protein
LDQHQAHSRHRPTAWTTWIGHTKVANFGAKCGGMTRSGSPSLHAILEEPPSQDDSALSEGESSNSPLLRACNMMILAIPSLLHHHRRRPRCFRQHRLGYGEPLHQQPSLSNWRLIQRDDDVPSKTTSSDGPCSIEPGLLVIGRP